MVINFRFVYYLWYKKCNLKWFCHECYCLPSHTIVYHITTDQWTIFIFYRFSMVYRLFVLVYRCNENIECLEKCISYAKLQSISNYWCSFQIDPIKERLWKSCSKTLSKAQQKLYQINTCRTVYTNPIFIVKGHTRCVNRASLVSVSIWFLFYRYISIVPCVFMRHWTLKTRQNIVPAKRDSLSPTWPEGTEFDFTRLSGIH